MDLFLKNAKVMRVVGGKRVDAGPIQKSRFAEHVQNNDRFGDMPQLSLSTKLENTKTHNNGNGKGSSEGNSRKKRAVAHSASSSSGKTKSSTTKTTSVGTVQNAVTVQEVIDIRCKEAEIQRNALALLNRKLFDVDEQLKVIVRSRKNVSVYKRLVERRDALRAEISRQSLTVPTTVDIVQEMIDFYSEQKQKREQKQQQQQQKKETDILRQTDALSMTGASEVEGSAGMAIQFSTESVPRIAEVTFGAPIIESSEYSRLEEMLGACQKHDNETTEPSKRQETKDEKEKITEEENETAACSVGLHSQTTDSMSTIDEDEKRFQQQNALADIDFAFDEAVRADVTEHAMQEVLVLAFLISPASRGWNAIDRQDTLDAERSAKGFEPAVALGKKLLESKQQIAGQNSVNNVADSLATTTGSSNGRKRKYDLVTIGANRGFVPTGSKIRNRLNIKMKDIRNTKNVSMLNFATVKKRKRTNQESETIEFVRFIGEKHFHDEVVPMSYDDPLCEDCQTPIDIDMKTGMETCVNCGLTIYGGTGREIIPLEQEMHNKYQYLKVGHMKTILKRSQGKETTRIPQKVPNAVTKQLKMERANFDEVCAFRIKRTLKKLGLSRWYDHMHQIAHIVTGRRPHQFTGFEEEVILAIFEHLVEPYENHRPRNQENFPYYYYALHKVCQLLGYPKEVLRNFPILQNVEKHRQKERIWEKMMNDLGWPYYTS